MTRLLYTTALALVLASGTALAQSDAPAELDATPPEVMDPVTPAPEAETGTETEAAAETEVWEPAQDALLADSLIGADVVNEADEPLGAIQNLLIAVVSDPSGDALIDETGAMDSVSPPITSTEPLPLDNGAASDGGLASDPMAPGTAMDAPADGAVDGSADGAIDDPAAASDSTLSAPDSESLSDNAAPVGEAPAGEDTGDLAADGQTSDGLPADSAPAGESSESLASDGLSSDGLSGEGEPADELAADDPLADPAIEPVPEAGAELGAEEGIASDEIAESPAISDPLPSGGESVMAPTGDEASEVKVTEIVVGVGGFLGIGERRVAIPADRFEFFTSADGERKVVLDATVEELEAMPDFIEADDGTGVTAP